MIAEFCREFLFRFYYSIHAAYRKNYLCLRPKGKTGETMATKKKSSSKRGQDGTDINVRAAMASGKSAADEVIAFRAKQLRKRAATESKLPARRRAPAAAPRLPPKARGLFGTRKTVGVLVAEGDSWFDYPMQDV